MAALLASRDNQAWSEVPSWVGNHPAMSFPPPAYVSPNAYEAHSPPLTGTPLAGFATILYWSYSPIRSLRPESTRILGVQMQL